MALARYESVAVNLAGDVIPNATVEVRRDEPGRPIVPLFSDRDGTVALGNPITADSEGKFGFHVAGGAYYVRVFTGPSQQPMQQYVRRYQAIGTAAERDVEDLATALETGTATFPLQSELNAFVPLDPGIGGKVYADPDPSKNGFYAYEGDLWVWKRPLYDTISRLTIVGGTANDIIAEFAPGVDGASVVTFFIEPTQTNTDDVTINDIPVLAFDGEQIEVGAWIEGRTYWLTDEGDHYRVRSEQGPQGTGLDFDVQVDELADRAAYDAQADGFRVLVSDVGDGRAAIYSRRSATPGVWSDPAYVARPAITAVGAGTGIDVDDTDPEAPEVSVVPFTGDSGSGGALGGVPAPAAGDAAKRFVLKASGGWGSTGGGAGDNPMLNPDHEVCQNPTSVAAAADGTEVSDRWVYNKTGAAVHTVSRDTDAPTIAQQIAAGIEHPRLMRYSFRANLTTPDDSIAAGDHVVIVQKLEGTRFRTFAQQARKGRCWFKSTITGTFSVSFRNGASDLGACVQITINAANTWELKEFDIPATPSSGTWVYDNSGCGLRVGIVLVAGSTFQGAAYGTWYSGSIHAVAGQTNFCATGSTDFRFTGFEIFDAAEGPTKQRYLDEELKLCRRLRRRYTGLIANTKLMIGVSSSGSTGEFIIEGMREVTAVTESGAVLREEGVGSSGITGITVHDAAEGLAHIIATCGGGLTTDRPVAIALTGTSDYLDIASVF
jgi:hypothetical protein